MVALAQRYRTLLVTRVFLFGLASMLATIGCESERAPTSASLDGTPAPAPGDDDKVYLVFSPGALGAAKVADDSEGDWLSTSKVAEPDETTLLKIKDVDLNLKLKIPEGAVDEPVLITMGVQPAPLSWIVVELGPSDQGFDPSAELTLEIDAELVDMDLSALQALYASDDGYLGDATIISIAQTPGEATQNQIDVLQDIVDANPGTSLADKVEDAIASLQNALYELTKMPPDNQAAVGNIEGAVGELEAAVNDRLLDPVEGADRMDELAEIARRVASDAVNRAIAQGGDPQELAEAQQALADGDALRATGEFKDAVNEYKNAGGVDDNGDASPSYESVIIKIQIPHFSRYGLRNSSYSTLPAWYYYGNENYVDYLDNMY